jgi:hypothetical protein
MINFNFKIELPIDRWETIWSTTGKTPFPHKYWDFDFFRSADIVSFEFSWKTRTDHAGVNVGVGLFGYSVDFRFYDSRHWDDENNCLSLRN